MRDLAAEIFRDHKSDTYYVKLRGHRAGPDGEARRCGLLIELTDEWLLANMCDIAEGQAYPAISPRSGNITIVTGE